MPDPLNLRTAASSLHASRHRDSLMADWARKYGQALIAEIERLRDERRKAKETTNA